MATLAEPPDEQISSRPEVIKWWVEGAHGLPLPCYPMEERFSMAGTCTCQTSRL